MGNVTGYLICNNVDYFAYSARGILPESGYRRIFFMAESDAERCVNERPVRNLKILKFSVPKKWITNYNEDLKLFECTHELSLRKHLRTVK